MSDKTGIEWTESTWNPVTGCTKVSQGCKNCYAERDWKNEHKADNRIGNLELKTRPEHNAHHNQERGRDDCGRFKEMAGRELDGRTWDEYPV